MHATINSKFGIDLHGWPSGTTIMHMPLAHL